MTFRQHVAIMAKPAVCAHLPSVVSSSNTVYGAQHDIRTVRHCANSAPQWDECSSIGRTVVGPVRHVVQQSEAQLVPHVRSETHFAVSATHVTSHPNVALEPYTRSLFYTSRRYLVTSCHENRQLMTRKGHIYLSVRVATFPTCN